MITIDSIAASASPASVTAQKDQFSALRFITCGSVDDGKSTLIGRLLVDSKAVLQDHLAGVQRAGETDLALLTDGLSAEREQGITIDVAYRYFNTESRKFIIGDAPGHAQYTRNMVTAASQADAAVVLVDASKLDWKNPELALLEQTRRHSLLVHLLRVPSLVFAVNKLDAVADPELAWQHISAALAQFANAAGIAVRATVPVSALKGWNVVTPQPEWCGYEGPSLIQILEQLPGTVADQDLPLALPVQWVEKFSSSADTSQGRRVFWGRVAAGSVAPGTQVHLFPSGQSATVAQVLSATRRPGPVSAGQSAGLVLDREVDVSRGDWILATASASATPPAADPDGFDDVAPANASAWPAQREISATVAWMDDEPLVVGRVYWALHGHRWVKAKVQRVVHRLNVHTLAEEEASALEANAIGHARLVLQEPLPAAAFGQARALGSLILVDTASHRTAAAVLLH